jgi:hypothetical protein
MTLILQRYETISFCNMKMIEKKDQFRGTTPSGVLNDWKKNEKKLAEERGWVGRAWEPPAIGTKTEIL